MSNTQLRIVSALVLALVVAVSILLGTTSTLIFIGLIGLLVIDEVIVNFLNYKRKHINYLISQVSYVLGFSYVNFIDHSIALIQGVNNVGLLFCASLIYYLFFTKHESNRFQSFISKYTSIVGAVMLLPLLNLSALVHEDQWVLKILGLVILNFSVDIAAWFWGKNFGKNKLWPKVSPNKTIEGFVGGIISAVLITGVYWSFFIHVPSTFTFMSFFLIATCSQVGDLVQSKVKRQFAIKDSSNLIPGHGGVYDRVDSLLFVAPLYLWLILKL
jgi:phosphatidate cytidylyltransferase